MGDIVTICCECSIVLADRLYHETREMTRESVYDKKSEHTPTERDDDEPLMELSELLDIPHKKNCPTQKVSAIREVVVTIIFEYSFAFSAYLIEFIDIIGFYVDEVILYDFFLTRKYDDISHPAWPTSSAISHAV